MKGYKIGIGEDAKTVFLVSIELDIPEEYPGLRIMSDDRQFRSNVARVLKIKAFNRSDSLKSAVSLFDHDFVYRPGEIVVPNHYDQIPVICAGGIHFFLNPVRAYLYSTTSWPLAQLLDYSAKTGKGLRV